MQKEIIDKEGNIIVSDLLSICRNCIISNSANCCALISCPLDNEIKRVGMGSTNNGVVYACASDSKTKRNFKIELDALIAGIKYFSDVKRDIINQTVEDENNRINRLIHNLRSLNGQANLLLNKIVPQDQFLKNINSSNAVSIVEDVVSKNTRGTALTSLRLAKILMHIKSEFFVYEINLTDTPKLQIEDHNLRNVIMLVLYKFFGELYDKNVFVEVDNYYESSPFDFDTFSVAFYYIVENISKYVCPDTTIKIYLNKKVTKHVITIEMRSLHLEKEEEGLIFHQGYSGKSAKSNKMSGKGIGMYQAKRLLEMNGGTIDFVAGEETYDIDGLSYSDNIINVEMPIDKIK